MFFKPYVIPVLFILFIFSAVGCGKKANLYIPTEKHVPERSDKMPLGYQAIKEQQQKQALVLKNRTKL